MYDVYSYGRMVANRPRMQAYVEALRRTVKPGSVVADLGTGTGIFALLACSFGARHVYAIEPNDSIHVARQIAEANGLASRITFYQELSTRVTLPEPADVIVSDLRGGLPLFGEHIPAIVDARSRLLAPGGALIPLRDHLRVAPAEAASLHATLTNPWLENDYGLDMKAAYSYVVNSQVYAEPRPEWLLAELQTWATVDYQNVSSPHVGGDVTFTCTKAGTVHGLLLWFDAVLAEGVGFSNYPGGPELVYGSRLLPLSKPVDVCEGDSIAVNLAANLVGGNYVWRWETTVREPGTGRVQAALKQSTFDAVVLVPSRLRKRAEDYRPVANEEGVADLMILGMMDGTSCLADIARRVHERFQSRFATVYDALEHVRALSERYSK